MSGLIERGAMKLARWVAGPERAEWLRAMDGELAYLREKRLDWALGSLVAAIKDRSVREWQFCLALAVLPALALLAIIPVASASFFLTRMFGAPHLPGPVALLTPLPFAYLLGRVRPRWNPFMVGLAGFAIYQFMPVIVWRTVIGPGMAFNWGPNLWQLGLQPVFQLVPASMWMWMCGAAVGAKRANRRRPLP